MYASLWAIKPIGAVKAKVRLADRGEIRFPSIAEPAHSRGVCEDPGLPGLGRRTKSVHAGTRKMVTYARPGRSQGKLWWRSAAILTCKSIV